MRINAAVLWEQGRPLSVEAIDLGTPGPGEVLVEMRAAGVCHSDLHPARGDWPMKTPVVLGHEGAGIVREVGAGVTRIRKDDHIVLCWAPACGVCPACLDGRSVLCDRLDKVTFRNTLPSGATHLRARDQTVAPFLGPACFGDCVTVVLTGLSRADSQGTIAMFPFVMQEKRLIGSVYGSGRPATDIPRLVQLFQEGRLKLRELVARTYALPAINDALAALESADGGRGVVVW